MFAEELGASIKRSSLAWCIEVLHVAIESFKLRTQLGGSLDAPGRN